MEENIHEAAPFILKEPDMKVLTLYYDIYEFLCQK